MAMPLIKRNPEGFQPDVLQFPSTALNDFDKLDHFAKDLKSHIDKRFSEVQAKQTKYVELQAKSPVVQMALQAMQAKSVEVQAKHVAGLSNRQCQRIVWLCLSSIAAGAALSLAIITPWLPGLPPVPFFLSLFFPAMGLAASCGLALSEGNHYDEESR